MSHRVRWKPFAAALAAFFLATASWAADKTHAETTDVVVVEVPVQVIDGGEPVRGLTAANFELFDGRKKVPVTGFEVLDLAAAPGAGAAGVPASARRHFLLLFDLVFADPTSVLRGREAAKDVIKLLHPADLVAVATYSVVNGPQLVLGFTPDRAQATAAIDTLGMPEMFDRAADPLRLVMAQAPASAPSGGGTPAENRAERDAALKQQLDKLALLDSRGQKTTQQLVVRNMTQQFADLARMMGVVDGRKYVVLLSEGFDSSLVTGSGNAEAGLNDLQSAIEDAGAFDDPNVEAGGSGSDSTFGDTRTQNLLEKMLNEFRRADCQIQAVDIGGLRAIAAEGRLRANGRESLLTMAKDTGGELYENFNDLATAMGQMLRRTGVTYVLSFQPQGLKLDGEFHKLRVELKGGSRSARVVHRPGYYPPRPLGQQPPLQRLLDTADSLMGEAGGSIGAAVLAAALPAAGNRAYVPVLVEVDGTTLLAGMRDSKQVPLELYVYAIDEQGVVHDFRTQSLALDLAKAEAQLRQTGVKFFGHLALPTGKYALRTLVRNATTGATSLRVDELVVPAFGAGAEAVLLPAMFPEQPGRWVMVRETLQAGEQQPPYPFMLAGQPFIPASRPVLVAGKAAGLVLQGYNLGSGTLTAKAEVVGADGSAQGGGPLALGAKEGGGSGVVRVAGTFEPPALGPGDYVLRVTLTDSGGKAAVSSTAFSVAGAGAAAPGR